MRASTIILIILLTTFSGVSYPHAPWRRYVTDEATYKLYQYLTPGERYPKSYWILHRGDDVTRYDNVTSTVLCGDSVTLHFVGGGQLTLPGYTIHRVDETVCYPPAPIH